MTTTGTSRSHPRTLAIVDADNILGTERFAADRAAPALPSQLAAVAELDPGDHVIVGSDVTIGYAVGVAFPGRRLVVGRGKNGADNALLQAAGQVALLAERYGRIVIASGDRSFALLADALRRAGVEVWVVSRPESLSRVLASAATQVRFFANDYRQVAA